MSSEIVIKVENVSKTFRLPHEKQSSVKSFLINFNKRGYEKQKALDNVSFEVKKGEFFGIVGRNGSGKSTLLKLLAGIYSPSKGNIQINGKLTPFIELGVGFNMELTGRENVYLNGALLGFNRKEMNKLYKDIVEFAELERFMDQKLKNYSSGMQVRLAFSIAIRAQSDILVLDEVLAVGDINFQKKSKEHFRLIKEGGCTVVFVTHDMEAARNFCDRIAVIEKGQVVFSGDVNKAIDKYDEYMAIDRASHRIKSKEELDKEINKDVSLNKANVLCNGKQTEVIKYGDDIKIILTGLTKIRIDNAIFGIEIRDSNDTVIFGTNNKINHVQATFNKSDKFEIGLGLKNIFKNDTYSIAFAIKSSDKVQTFAKYDRVLKFESVGAPSVKSLVLPQHSLELKTGGKND